MKKSIIAFIFLATLFLSACQKNGNDLPQTSYNEEIDLTDNVEKDAEVSFAEEQKNQFETISGINNDVLKIISISDADFEYYVKDSIVISDEEIIDRTEWIEENKCYLVSIARTQDVEGEYKHLRDYIFVRDTSFKCIEVSYPSKFDSIDSDRYVFDACDFEVEYKDVRQFDFLRICL